MADDKKVRMDRWLKTEPNWRFRLGDECIPEKTFAGGLSSAVGLWVRHNQPSETDLTHVVLKQVDQRFGDDGIGPEAKALQLLNTANAQHIVKMYRRKHEDISQGTNSQGDNDPKVERIYPEYCPSVS